MTEGDGKPGNKYRMVYYLPHQPRGFSGPEVFETDDMEKLQEAIGKAQSNGYEVVSIEMI